ncbi:MAG: hypothetical protein WC044_06470 [Crocinitomicaceae bacterium]
MSLNAQNEDFIINNERDTIFCQLTTKLGKVRAQIDGKEVKYSPKDILRYSQNGRIFVSGRVSNPANYGAKSWMFLELIVDGPMMLCFIYNVNTTTNEATKEMEVAQNITYHAVLRNDTELDFTMIALNWKKKLKSLDETCSSFNKMVDKSSFGQIQELVLFYNENCGNN